MTKQGSFFVRKFQNATTRIWIKYAKERFAIYSRNLEFAVEGRIWQKSRKTKREEF